MIGFWTAFGLLIGYLTSFAFIALAVLKPIFPANVGVQYFHGFPVSISAHFPMRPGNELGGGYWVVPFALFCWIFTTIRATAWAMRFANSILER